MEHVSQSHTSGCFVIIMLDSLLSAKVELGFDIATSVTIIGAIVSWGIENRRQSRRERQIGINERTRAESLAKIQRILSEMEDQFSSLVYDGEKFDKIVFRKCNVTEHGIDSTQLAVSIKQEPSIVDDQIHYLEKFADSLELFFVATQTRRYSLKPVLDSLTEGDKFIEEFQNDILHIIEMRNRFIGGWMPLLRQYRDVCNFALEHADNEFPNESNPAVISQALYYIGEYRQQAYDIAFNSTNLQWMLEFIDDDHKDDFIELVENDEKIDENNPLVIMSTINMTIQLLMHSEEVLAALIVSTTLQIQKARGECKDILIKLSALSHTLLSNNESLSVLAVANKYEKDEFFGKETVIR